MDIKYDLNAPAFGDGAQKIEETTSEAEAQPVVGDQKETIEASEEESKVPYSRFKKFHDEAKSAREEADYWRQKAEAIKPEPVSTESELPDFWKELYGDSDASQKAWKIQSRANEELREQAKQEALEAVRNERYEEAERTEQNVEILDAGFEDLSALVGRDLTDKEQSALLDIVDNYTPKDRDGNYSGQILPFEKAWEIYELKQGASKAPQIKARNQIAGLSGSQTQGETNISEKDKNFNPFDWNAYQRRI